MFLSTNLLEHAIERMERDGINSIKYKLAKIEIKKTFTRLFINYNDKDNIDKNGLSRNIYITKM